MQARWDKWQSINQKVSNSKLILLVEFHLFTNTNAAVWLAEVRALPDISVHNLLVCNGYRSSWKWRRFLVSPKSQRNISKQVNN